MSEPKPWHQLFGLSLVDFFRGMPVTVELEKDLSLKQQLLDVVLIRKGVEPLSHRLPDGFDNLPTYTLVTFKSYQEALDGWTLNELIGHYVNCRKQLSPSMKELLPESDFLLLAVCVRFPQSLTRDATLTRLQAGVYEVRHFTRTVRIVVVHELPKEAHNALLHLFSAREEQVRYGATHYQQRSAETSTLMRQLFQRYNLEVTLMPTGLEQLKQFAEETIEELLKELPPERRIKGLPTEELLRGVSFEERLRDVPTDELLRRVPPKDRLKGLSLDEFLATLSPEDQIKLRELFK